MSEGFIVRTFGGGEQTLAPTITEVSTTITSITFTITNNDTASGVILWEIGDNTPDENSVELAGGATSNLITVTDLAANTQHSVFATANVTGKKKSNVTETNINTTDAADYILAVGGDVVGTYEENGKFYKYHEFKNSSNFIVQEVGPSANDRNKIEFLIIGGGGGGAGRLDAASGGGAGGYISSVVGEVSGANTSPVSKSTVQAQTYPIIVGAGGRAGITTMGYASSGGSGVNTTAFGLTAIGGGAGAGTSREAHAGGSGGGAAANANSVTANLAGTGTANQGTNGGYNGTSDRGGGGGGALTAGTGSGGSNPYTGSGGNGIASSITGTSITRAGGGGSRTTWWGSGVNGAGGGSNVQGGGGFAQANGGAGVVIVRYEVGGL